MSSVSKKHLDEPQKKKSKARKSKPVSIQKRIGLVMPVGRVLSHMRCKSYKARVSNAAGVAVGAFLERLAVNINSAASKRTLATTRPNKETGTSTITHHHVNGGIDDHVLYRSLMRRQRLPTPVGHSGLLVNKSTKKKQSAA